jgi:hypothetical protein
VGERTDNKAFKLTRSATSKLPRPLQLNAVLGRHRGESSFGVNRAGRGKP